MVSNEFRQLVGDRGRGGACLQLSNANLFTLGTFKNTRNKSILKSSNLCHYAPLFTCSFAFESKVFGKPKFNSNCTTLFQRFPLQ